MKTTIQLLLLSIFSLSLMYAKPSTSKSQINSSKIHSSVADSGGPDSWGYTWVTNTQPGGPQYQWLDSTDGWNRVEGLTDDNSVGFFDLGFTFNYYWYTANRIQIGSNGWIGFESTLGNLAAAFTQFPNSSTPNNVIAPLGADFDFSVSDLQNSRTYYWTNNVDTAVVSWVRAVEWFTNPPPAIRPTYSFQLLILKNDSSIIFQYGDTTNGTVAANFSSESNITMGIENVTGTIGLSYYFASGVIDPSKYLPGTAVRIKKTVETGFQAIDAGILGGFNDINGAVFLQTNVNNEVYVVVKNYGTTNLSNVRVRHAITRGITTLLRDTIFIDSISLGEEVMASFSRPFNPTVAGVHSTRFTVEVTGDLLATNNAKNTETNVINVLPNTPILLAYDDNAPDGTGRSWGGPGGFGNEFEIPFAAKIESAYVRVLTVGTGLLTVTILDDDGPNGSPGTILSSQEITPVAGVNKVYFGTEDIRLDGGKFYIGETGQHTYAVDATAPLSNRGWEITSGWGANRFGATEDVMVRAVVTTLGVSVNEYLTYLPKGYEIEQNYPNPFNPSTSIRFSLSQKSNIKLVVYDILGNEVKTLVNEAMNAGTHSLVWNGTNHNGNLVHSGVYFYRLKGDNFSTTKKMMLLK